MVNHARAVQVVLFLVQTTSRSLNLLENVLFSRKQDRKLQIASRNPACSIYLGCLAQPKQNKKPLQFPLMEIKEQIEVYCPLDLASGNLGGAGIPAAAASCMQQPNCNSMPNLAHNIVSTATVI